MSYEHVSGHLRLSCGLIKKSNDFSGIKTEKPKEASNFFERSVEARICCFSQKLNGTP